MTRLNCVHVYCKLNFAREKNDTKVQNILGVFEQSDKRAATTVLQVSVAF